GRLARTSCSRSLTTGRARLYLTDVRSRSGHHRPEFPGLSSVMLSRTLDRGYLTRYLDRHDERRPDPPRGATAQPGPARRGTWRIAPDRQRDRARSLSAVVAARNCDRPLLRPAHRGAVP